MDLINNLFYGTPDAWSGGIAHSVIILACVIFLGKMLGKCKIWGISLGVTWILFVSLAFAHFNMNIDKNLTHFVKEFGLILFVYSIGLQVGPSFFSNFKSGGMKLNLIAATVILLGVGTTIALMFATGNSITTMVGIMSGAVTNTPGLGAAQHAYFDVTKTSATDIAQGYAVAYPLGVIGCIGAFILIRKFFGKYTEQPIADDSSDSLQLEHKQRSASKNDNENCISRKILISKPKLNGVRLRELEFGKYLGATITRINRAGTEIAVTEATKLQQGDIVTVVGSESSVKDVESVLGNSLKRLDEPNLLAIFLGIALGCLLGSIPIKFPGIPQPVKLGLAGGPLIVSILISRFGPQYKVATYTTTSANLMIREIGISLFLASVGLEAGGSFVSTIANGGYIWVAYGAIITIVPVAIAGIIGRYLMHIDYNTLIGAISGACTNPPALAYASEIDRSNDRASIGYATVYPLSMFLRVLLAQMLVLLFV